MARRITMTDIPLGNHIVTLIRKSVKGIRLSIKGPPATIRLTAPFAISEAQIIHFAQSKLAWLNHHVAKINQRPIPPPIAFTSGETHYIRGMPLILNVISDQSSPTISLNNNVIVINSSKARSTVKRRNALEKLYKNDLSQRAQKMINHWQSIMNVEVRTLKIRKMRARWGSCHLNSHLITLNLELARRSDRCLELVVVHELTHLLERYHTKRFYALMDHYLPSWQSYQEELFNGLAVRKDHDTKDDFPNNDTQCSM